MKRARPSFRQQIARNVAAIAQHTGGELPADLQASLAKMRVPKQRASATDIDAAHLKRLHIPEADVLRAISEMLAVHPGVLLAVRQNTGAASYESATGRYQPVWFYNWIKSPGKMTVPDVWGFTRAGYFAIEVKRSDWRKPRDDRELAQAAFLAFVRYQGGRAGFATSVEQARAIIED